MVYRKLLVVSLLLAVIFMVFGTWPSRAAAKERGAHDQVPSPPQAVDALRYSLELSGAGDFDVMFWDIYTAALWAPGGDYSPQQPHVLAIRYERDFEGKDIAERSIVEIEGLGLGDPDQHENWLGRMKALFPDVAEGDQLTGVHFPGERALFFHNEERIGSIDDPEFAAAFFAIWLDEDTSAPDLRERLLGGAMAARER